MKLETIWQNKEEAELLTEILNHKYHSYTLKELQDKLHNRHTKEYITKLVSVNILRQTNDYYKLNLDNTIAQHLLLLYNQLQQDCEPNTIKTFHVIKNGRQLTKITIQYQYYHVKEVQIQQPSPLTRQEVITIFDQNQEIYHQMETFLLEPVNTNKIEYDIPNTYIIKQEDKNA